MIRETEYLPTWYLIVSQAKLTAKVATQPPLDLKRQKHVTLKLIIPPLDMCTPLRILLL